MKPGYSVPHSQRLSNKPYPQPIPRIDTYFFNEYSNITLPSTPKDLFPGGFPVSTPTLLHSVTSSTAGQGEPHDLQLA